MRYLVFILVMFASGVCIAKTFKGSTVTHEEFSEYFEALIEVYQKSCSKKNPIGCAKLELARTYLQSAYLYKENNKKWVFDRIIDGNGSLSVED